MITLPKRLTVLLKLEEEQHSSEADCKEISDRLCQMSSRIGRHKLRNQIKLQQDGHHNSDQDGSLWIADSSEGHLAGHLDAEETDRPI